MKHQFIEANGHGQLILLKEELKFEQCFFKQEKDFSFHTIAWNKGGKQTVVLDEIQYEFEANSILPIMMNQSFCFEKPEQIIAWQFNREFYCILNHDAEVGCVGFLFFGPSPAMFVALDDEHIIKIQKLTDAFVEEFNADESIKSEMLRMYLVQLIISITRLAKKQYVNEEEESETLGLLRQFNVAVEMHFKTERQVQFYASLMNKSPKTIANIFSLYSKKTPLEIIHARVIAEAKRLLYYTDKSVKEIAIELGFEDASHFSKFFKKATSLNPSSLKKNTLL